jgi:hypothetical protein
MTNKLRFIAPLLAARAVAAAITAAPSATGRQASVPALTGVARPCAKPLETLRSTRTGPKFRVHVSTVHSLR